MNWISVEDRLPDVDVPVLLLGYDEDNESYMFTASLEESHAIYSDLENKWFSYGVYSDGSSPSYTCYYATKVTHWMPLPPLPMEDI